MYGWNEHGEYHCPCGTQFGKNLKGESPFALVAQHVRQCVPNAIHCLKSGHSMNDRHPRYLMGTWERAIQEYVKGVQG